MKDEGEVHQSVVLPQEESTVLRLILQHPDDNRVLLVRYRAADDDWEPEQGKSRREHSPPTYWSYKGIGPLRPLGNESTIPEMIVRVAHAQLGVLIHDLELVVKLYDRRVMPPKIGRLYYVVRQWTGAIPFADDVETTGLRFEPNYKFDKRTDMLNLSHDHFWVPREFLGSYLSHPETVLATKIWQEQEKKKAKGAGA